MNENIFYTPKINKNIDEIDSDLTIIDDKDLKLRLTNNKKNKFFNSFIKSLEYQLTETRKGINTKSKEINDILDKNQKLNKSEYVKKLDEVFDIYDDSKSGQDLLYEYFNKRNKIFNLNEKTVWNNKNNCILLENNNNHTEMNNKLLSKLKKRQNEFDLLQEKYNKIEKELDCLKDFILQNRGQFKLLMRVKPNNGKSIISYIDNHKLEINKKVYFFDKIFSEDSNNSKIFSEIESAVFASLKGKNTNIWTYGQSGSGKTHTFEGNKDDKGILFIMIEKIINAIIGKDFTLQFNCYEVYNEKIFDLLRSESLATNLSFNVKKNGFVEINKSVTENIETFEQFNLLFNTRIKKYKKFNATKFNNNSSRSHTIYQFILNNKLISGTIRLIDLAGNEKFLTSSKTSSNLKQIQNESNYIKKSLTTWGRVFRYLKDFKNSWKSEKVNFFRESKLTTIIQDCFKKENQTIWILTLRQEPEFLNESKETLNFASLNN